MKDETVLLLRMINEGRTLNEISNALSLSNKQLFMRLSMLRNSGYLFDKHYNYKGDISYSISNPFKKDNSINIETNDDIKTIRAVLTSDTHLGNINDNVDCIDSMMEYCINEGIHIIFNVGDFFEGIYRNKNQLNAKFDTAWEQLSYGLNNYPYDQNILTLTVLGNHDATFWLEYGIDIKNALKDRRHDIIPVGYGYGEANIGPYKFGLQHPIERNDLIIIPPKKNPRKINLRGHSHKFKIVPSNNNILVYVPTMSSVPTLANPNPIPSMIDMTLKISDGQICSEYFQQFIFIDNKPIRIGEFQYNVQVAGIEPKTLTSKSKFVPKIDNNLKLSTEREKTISEQIAQEIIEVANMIKTEGSGNGKYSGMSQIEKFESKYGEGYQKVKK